MYSLISDGIAAKPQAASVLEVMWGFVGGGGFCGSPTFSCKTPGLPGDAALPTSAQRGNQAGKEQRLGDRQLFESLLPSWVPWTNNQPQSLSFLSCKRGAMSPPSQAAGTPRAGGAVHTLVGISFPSWVSLCSSESRGHLEMGVGEEAALRALLWGSGTGVRGEHHGNKMRED